MHHTGNNDTKDTVMNTLSTSTSTSTTTSTSSSRFARRVATSVLTAGLLFTASCGNPLAEDAQDISADVDVSGAASKSPSGEGTTRDVVETPENESAPSEPTSDPDDDEPANGTSTPESDDSAPFVEVDTRFNGRSTEYVGIDFTLGDLTVTNQTLTQFTAGAEPTGDDRILVIEVAVTNRGNGTVTVPIELIGIELNNGERLAPDGAQESDGASVYTIRPAAQATERVLLEFPAVDLTGARFVVSEANAIPQYIPFDPALIVADTYSLELPGKAPVAGLRSPSPWVSCNYAWSGQALSARILLDGVNGGQYQRANIGRRWLLIELQATNNTGSGNDFYPCNTAGMAISEIEPRLRIDGVSMGPSNRVSVSGRIDEDVTATVDYWFPIDADTAFVELTDVNGTVIGSWELDLPTVPGEE